MLSAMTPIRRTVIKPTYSGPPSYQSKRTIEQRFGERLSTLRAERGLSQLQLAIAADRDRSYISDLERGVKSATLETLQQIADAMNISFAELTKGL